MIAAFLSNFRSSFNLFGQENESRGNNKYLYHKARYFRHLLLSDGPDEEKFIIFTRTKHDACRLTCFLQSAVECEALHGRDTFQTQTSLARFRNGHLNVLVTSDDDFNDGLGIPDMSSSIIHFDVPSSSEVFLRRCGITGRVERTFFVHDKKDERDAVMAIKRDVGGDHAFSRIIYTNSLADRVTLFLDDRYNARNDRKTRVYYRTWQELLHDMDTETRPVKYHFFFSCYRTPRVHRTYISDSVCKGKPRKDLTKIIRK
ncbi:hypothetical protein PIB30_059995 [Stylosanthes scabra]|uniref:Helicase C-terminal domain-containing protein n=1 Tax=Stylosanthes scabra TaxID=79078 RepID=A0ABU6SLG8_9FABA|nr:hypothetical protein [Stylosanthes scabra]